MYNLKSCMEVLRTNGNTASLKVEHFDGKKEDFEHYKGLCEVLYQKCMIVAANDLRAEKRVAESENPEFIEAKTALAAIWAIIDPAWRTLAGDVNFLVKRATKSAANGAVNSDGLKDIKQAEKFTTDSYFRKGIEIIAGYKIAGMVFDGKVWLEAREDYLLKASEARKAAAKRRREAAKATANAPVTNAPAMPHAPGTDNPELDGLNDSSALHDAAQELNGMAGNPPAFQPLAIVPPVVTIEVTPDSVTPVAPKKGKGKGKGKVGGITRVKTESDTLPSLDDMPQTAIA